MEAQTEGCAKGKLSFQEAIRQAVKLLEEHIKCHTRADDTLQAMRDRLASDPMIDSESGEVSEEGIRRYAPPCLPTAEQSVTKVTNPQAYTFCAILDKKCPSGIEFG